MARKVWMVPSTELPYEGPVHVINGTWFTGETHMPDSRRVVEWPQGKKRPGDV